MTLGVMVLVFPINCSLHVMSPAFWEVAERLAAHGKEQMNSWLCFACAWLLFYLLNFFVSAQEFSHFYLSNSSPIPIPLGMSKRLCGTLLPGRVKPQQDCTKVFTEGLISNLKFSFNFRGKFAVVKKCIQKDTEKEFAAKFMRKRRKGQDCRMEIIHEIAVLELAQCNLWVINLHEVYETATEMILVLE